MASDNADDDLLTFSDEPEAPEVERESSWLVLIIDDEPSVHDATRLALRGIIVEGRPLAFLHAFTAAEARAILAERNDIAIALLDVVMESDDAGLRLTRYIREELDNQAIRIILRTGQPGYAPEIETIRAYDINDYKTKSELTRIRLFTSLTVAIRSFWQIHCLEANRRGLELIVAASTELSRPQGLHRFAQGVVTQLCALLGVDEEGIVCAAKGGEDSPYVLAAAGRYAEWMGRTLEGIPDERVRRQLARSLQTREHLFGESTCLFFNVPDGLSMAAYVDVDHPLGDVDRRLLEVFCGNIAVAFENTHLLNRISELAYEDQLVKLPNRNSFLHLIDQRPRTSDRLALVDIDGFTDMNTMLDQDFGDSVLLAVARRLREHFAESVTVARVGSDVFGLLGPSQEINPSTIDAVFAEPFETGDEKFRLSATSGLVRLGDSTQKASELMKNAGVALKQAKAFNRGSSLYFEMAFAKAARERMQMLSQLRLAFSVERLYLAYQPLVDLRSGRVVGAEALLRWRKENDEFVSPEDFIPLAEKSGLIVPIGDWVMRVAIQFAKRIVERGFADFRVAINVSLVQFREPDFVERFLQAIEENGIHPSNIEIELTESVAIDNIELIESRLAALHAAGVSLSIDDFGTGYSSLNIIRQLQVDRLKIDRAFVSGDDGKNVDHSIAELVIKLARQLGLRTVAEGIETEEQRVTMAGLGCDYAQGFLFSPAIRDEEFEAFLRDQSNPAS